MTITSSAPTRVLRVGQDLDGVWYPFDVSLVDFLRSEGFAEDRFVPVTHWHFYRDFGLTDAEFVAACHRGVDAGHIFRRGTPFPGALEAARRIAEAGHEIHVVTDRSFGAPGASLRATQQWLAEEGFPFDTLTISADKTVVAVDFFIEDRLENYDALDAAGVQVYLINRPWNAVPGDSRRRVDTHEQFTDIVLAAGQALTPAC